MFPVYSVTHVPGLYRADDLIRLLGNPLSVDDCGDLTTLISRGAIVEHDVPCEP